MQNIKEIVREKYTEIAEQDRETNANSCCGATATGTYTIMSESYAHLKGYDAGADLGLGCGLPTEFAQIREGDTVLDLGSGAGNDCFVARAEAGVSGKVIGVDFTPAMINKARQNAERLGFNNVEFRQGDIEALPVTDQTVDVVVSNCVLNLVPDKPQVFAEIFRVLRPGGHFSISDVVLEGELPESLRNAAELYAGCVSGASQMQDYLQYVKDAGFTGITIQKQKPIMIPDDILLEHITKEELQNLVAAGVGIYSITVYAEKPGGEPKPKFQLKNLGNKGACCEPGCCN